MLQPHQMTWPKPRLRRARPAAETTAGSPEDSQEALTYVASSDSTIGFVGSKVTGSHAGGFKTFTASVRVAGGELVAGGTQSANRYGVDLVRQ